MFGNVAELLNVFTDGRLAGSGKESRLRPVFLVKSGAVKIAGGDGKSEKTAYTLGIK